MSTHLAHQPYKAFEFVRFALGTAKNRAALNLNVITKNSSMKYISMMLIDPQVGFCSPSGSLGLKYGNEELSEIKKIIPNIKTAMDESYRRHIVTSEYFVGQFTDGDTKHALANLCVPQVNGDCHVIEELSSINYHSSTTIRQQSALSSIVFCSEIEKDFEIGIRRFVIAGFLLDHCVKATAEDLCLKLWGNGAEVKTMYHILNKYQDAGASAVILGCIELPLIIDSKMTTLDILDSTTILGDAAIQAAKV